MFVHTGVMCGEQGECVIWAQITPVFMVLTHSHNIIILPRYLVIFPPRIPSGRERTAVSLS